ncbi:MAG: CinA family nicotinamide mononucleotide deamidase-related protein [Ginsengibacter sp.]
MQTIKTSIITIGDELLIGQVIDTNSTWMAQELNKAGIFVKRRVAVGDTWDDIWLALDEESKLADIILITGGLGPTSDDITKPLLCKYFNGNMIINEKALQNVKYLFEKVFKRPMIESNLKQAEVPDVCTVLQNKRGTAPGMWFNKNGKIFISMPGVPFEMKGMMTDDIIPKLIQQFTLPSIIHKTLLTAGVGESFLAEQLKNFEVVLPAEIKLAYLPSYGMVRLRLTSSGVDKIGTQNKVESYFTTLQSLVKEYIVTNEDEPMVKVVGNLLIKKNKTVVTAESCTGGYIAHLITTIPGSSAFYKGSVVSYDNEVKEKVLNVSSETLKSFGAVSEETVKEMLSGILNRIGADYAIAVSGIMGPDGGIKDKPAGTVWIAVGNKQNVITQKLHFRFDRIRNIELTGLNALNILRKFILSEN